MENSKLATIHSSSPIDSLILSSDCSEREFPTPPKTSPHPIPSLITCTAGQAEDVLVISNDDSAPVAVPPPLPLAPQVTTATTATPTLSSGELNESNSSPLFTFEEIRRLWPLRPITIIKQESIIQLCESHKISDAGLEAFLSFCKRSRYLESHPLLQTSPVAQAEERDLSEEHGKDTSYSGNDRSFSDYSVSPKLGDDDVVVGLEPGYPNVQTTRSTTNSNDAQKVLDKMSPRGKNQPKGKYTLDTGTKAASKSSWSELVAKPFCPARLSYVAPICKNGDKLTLPTGLAQLGEDKWKNCLIGFFIEKALPFSIVKDLATRLWHKYGLLETLSSQKGVFIFKFDSASSCQIVLNKGPWLLLGKPLCLKPWTKEIDVNKNDFKTMNIWTNLYNIPLDYWTEEGLAAIASWLGKPLYLDEPTTKATRLTYARVCIEIPIESEFPSSFMVESEFGVDFEVKVEYSWIPKKCSHCMVFGHNVFSCSKAGKREWRPKTSEKEVVACLETREIPPPDEDWVRVPTSSSGLQAKDKGKSTISTGQGKDNTKKVDIIDAVDAKNKIKKGKKGSNAITTTNRFGILHMGIGEEGGVGVDASPTIEGGTPLGLREEGVGIDSHTPAYPTTTPLNDGKKEDERSPPTITALSSKVRKSTRLKLPNVRYKGT